jgi:hypothetical protein
MGKNRLKNFSLLAHEWINNPQLALDQLPVLQIFGV